MNFKSQKGYSLIEIGVGVLIITVLLVCSTSLFNGCFNIYSAVQQRNYVISHAVSRVEELLLMDVDTLLTEYIDEDTTVVYNDNDKLVDAVKNLNNAEGKAKLAAGEYYVPADKVEGDFYNSPETNNMRITTKIRRIPTDGDYAFDNTLIKISVLVEYTIKPQVPGSTVPENEILSYEVGTIKVTKL
ncbi:MAG: type II secretion system protein [Clostridia bacterium]|nr:type II secretion system protein [Clostridia bacterium]